MIMKFANRRKYTYSAQLEFNSIPNVKLVCVESVLNWYSVHAYIPSPNDFKGMCCANFVVVNIIKWETEFYTHQSWMKSLRLNKNVLLCRPAPTSFRYISKCIDCVKVYFSAVHHYAYVNTLKSFRCIIGFICS